MESAPSLLPFAGDNITILISPYSHVSFLVAFCRWSHHTNSPSSKYTTHIRIYMRIFSYPYIPLLVAFCRWSHHTILKIYSYIRIIQYCANGITITSCCHDDQAITKSHSIPSPPKVDCNPHQHHHMCISVSSLKATKCPKALERQRQF